MSNLESDPREAVCGGRAAVLTGPARDLLDGRDVALGGPRAMRVTRTLPTRGRRMVGAWCFADLYGPERAVMRVPPHPHTGLQTVSWLVEGEVLHRDSVGTEQLVTPGRLNLMTAGRGIAHSEESSPGTPVLHGAQLWVALPGAHRHVAPHFEHHPELPVLSAPGAEVTVIMGELGGAASPAGVYTPLVGAQVRLDAGGEIRLPLEPGFEHALLVLSGEVEADGDAPEGAVTLAGGPLLYLGDGRSELALSARRPARVLLLGGEPFAEEIVMWWNFVGRGHDEIVAFREEWASGALGVVHGFDGPPLPAPALPTSTLKPRGRER
ncbi:hypothetical protein Misp01_17270 [Microtetraspora sp. NBRC 13810]|uniref:pirin family protein n=1 Tax=Microtetraspora sp. NBRC 13810 TaxID=3030990 RepID=UPI0024A087E8|nr:pirin family protein [Microtetraspora sp. NBRC 13810]GLW06597.1 hypothetical protein Misp01_17270 [Microtetraspora sp. NBRC 13810]